MWCSAPLSQKNFCKAVSKLSISFGMVTCGVQMLGSTVSPKELEVPSSI